MLKTEDGGDTQASAGKAGGMKNLRQACLKEKKKAVSGSTSLPSRSLPDLLYFCNVLSLVPL